MKQKLKIYNAMPILIVIFLMIFLSACAPRPNQVEKNANSFVENTTEEVESVVEASREVVFTYGGQQNLPPRLILTLGGEPVLFPSGYVRLVGVVSGGKPTACLELGGRGLALGIDDSLDGYRMASIQGQEVVLIRKNRKQK
jgi:hypothetical protein